MSEFKRIKRGEKEYTALRFGSDRYEIPQHIMQGERKECLLITQNGTERVPWYGITKDDGGQYLLLPPLLLDDITSLSTVCRENALSLIRMTASALKSASSEFPDLLTGIFPLYRIYIEGGRNILLLPPDAGSILTLSRLPEQMDRDVRNLIAADREEGYSLILEMAELMYYAAAGRFPYEMSEVRGSHFSPYPLSLFGFEDSTTTRFIMNALMMPEKNQRKIAGNRGPVHSLEWFLGETENLEWNYASRSEADRIYDIKKAEEKPEFIKARRKKTKRSERLGFLRKKGLMIAVCILIFSLVSYFVGNYLYQTFRPPLTRDYSPRRIIEHTIECQNTLNAQDINEGFKKECAQYMEVTSLYVTERTRSVYEGKSPIVNVDDYLEDKGISIGRDSIVYGAVIRDIEETGKDTYTAHLDWYTPYGFTEEDENAYEKNDSSARIFVYDTDEEFVFEWNRRGWWECTSSSITQGELKKVLYIPYSET